MYNINIESIPSVTQVLRFAP